MLTFIKNKITKKQSTKVEAIEPASPNITVEQIHNEFNTACDRLLKEAYDIIAKADEKVISKGNDLRQLGFSNAVGVKEAILAKNITDKQKVIANLIKSYERISHLYKFITRSEVEKLCAKYNLVCGPLNCYTGFVPQKNLDEYKAFVKFIDNMSSSYRYDKPKGLEDFKTPLIIHEEHSKIITSYKKLDSGNSITQEDSFLIEKLMAAGEVYYYLYGYAHNIVYYKDGSRIVKQVESCTCIEHKGYSICAPVKDMNLGKSIAPPKSRIFGSPVEMKAYPDPVILKAVKGGYLIVTAWGEEASDPIVVNQNNN